MIAIAEEVWKNYAQALINVAAEKNIVEETGRSLDAFAEVYGAREDLRKLLESPRVKAAAKESIVESIGEALKLSVLTQNFIKLLAHKNRVKYLVHLSKEYKKLSDELAKRQTAYVTTVIPLTGAQQDRLKTVLKRASGRSVKLKIRQNEAIIGGIVAQIGDKLYDGSVKGELQAIGKSLMKGVD